MIDINLEIKQSELCFTDKVQCKFLDLKDKKCSLFETRLNFYNNDIYKCIKCRKVLNLLSDIV